MKSGSARGPRAVSGFTLVEILVVMALMSMVMLGLGAAMRTIAQTEDRVDRRLQRTDEMRVAANFLSSTLGRVSARKTAAPTPAGSSPYLFAGTPNAVMWVGVMPARYGAGGRSYFRLALENQGSARVLVIRFAPWNASAVFPDWASADSRVLVPDVAGFGLEYAGDEGAAWVPQWSDLQRLPARIRIHLRTPAAEWPFLVVPMHQLPGGRGDGDFTIGGSE